MLHSYSVSNGLCAEEQRIIRLGFGFAFSYLCNLVVGRVEFPYNPSVSVKHSRVHFCPASMRYTEMVDSMTEHEKMIDFTICIEMMIRMNNLHRTCSMVNQKYYKCSIMETAEKFFVKRA